MSTRSLEIIRNSTWLTLIYFQSFNDITMNQLIHPYISLYSVFSFSLQHTDRQSHRKTHAHTHTHTNTHTHVHTFYLLSGASDFSWKLCWLLFFIVEVSPWATTMTAYIALLTELWILLCRVLMYSFIICIVYQDD